MPASFSAVALPLTSSPAAFFLVGFFLPALDAFISMDSSLSTVTKNSSLCAGTLKKRRHLRGDSSELSWEGSSSSSESPRSQSR
eukprot:10584_6